MELFNNLRNAEIIANLFPKGTFFNIEVTEYSITMCAYSSADLSILDTMGYEYDEELHSWKYRETRIVQSQNI